MPNFGRRIDGPAGRRRAPREEVVLAASALSLKGTRAVVVTDVSPVGAKLLGRNLAALEKEVLLTVGGVELFADIVWVERDECGITFDSPLPAETVDHLKREGRWAKVMGVPSV